MCERSTVTSKPEDATVAGANEFYALSDRTVFSLFTALLLAFALAFAQNNVAGPQDFQSTSLLDRYFQKRVDFICNKDFLAAIGLQIAVLLLIFVVNPSDVEGLIYICYLIALTFIVSVMLFAFNTVRKTLARGRWFLLPPLAVSHLRKQFPSSFVPSTIYRPPSLL